MSTMAWLFVPWMIVFPVDAATAHAQFEGAGGFYSGLLHPLFVPAHLLAVTGIGLLIGQQASLWRRAVPTVYVGGLILGFAGMVASVVPVLAGEALLAAAAASGMLVALARPMPLVLGCTLAVITGLALALDSPPQAISVREANVILIGTFSGAAVLLLAVVECSAVCRRQWQRIGTRILGSWIAAGAILALALRLAR
jgi:urease accessory protein